MYDPESLEKDIARIRQSGYLNPDWYRATYRDVDILGIEPAEHYLKYGARMRRDPGPEFSTGFFLDTHPGGWQQSINPLLRFLGKNAGEMTPHRNTILWAAQNVALRGSPERAVQLAETYLSPGMSYTTQILRANVALMNGTKADWLQHVNAFLARYGAEPICLTSQGDQLIEQLSTRPLPPVTGGPLISVIMPAWNAEKTIAMAARSILNQTWQNLELLIVDDGSTDGTWPALQDLAKKDNRVRILRNTVNVGPYVSKNVALMQARGGWITGHDADDWAHPQRLEHHFKAGSNSRASLSYMLRMKPDGCFEHFTKIGNFSNDGVARVSSISCLFERDLLVNTLGFWDSVRYGADSEMIERAKRALGSEFQNVPQIGMICLDLESSLTNHPEHGIKTSKGLSDSRRNYKEAWLKQHQDMTVHTCYLDFCQSPRKYATTPEHAVPEEKLRMLQLFAKA